VQGRLSAGVCYRMWTKATHERLAEHRIPEIMEADLASLVLDMAMWGVTDILQLTWLSPPPKSHILQATDTLTPGWRTGKRKDNSSRKTDPSIGLSSANSAYVANG
jgi:hypothetical protein